MKKITAVILSLVLLLSLFSCGKKEEIVVEPVDDPVLPVENNENIEGDPLEYGRDFWEAKFPGENICPFYIEENGREMSYYWVSGFTGWEGTIESWLSQPFNWNGWHKTTDGLIVNKDETLKITENWANGEESMSSYCTVTTEKYDSGNQGASYDTDSVTSAYAFNPPQDNYFVEINVYDEGKAFVYSVEKKENVFTEIDELQDRRVRYDYNEETAYTDDFRETYGWTKDGDWFADAPSYEEQTVSEFAYFEDYFMGFFYGYGKTVDQLKDFLTGTEKIADCGCWIFDANGFNGVDLKFWINMENGICMKMEDKDGVCFEVTKIEYSVE